MPKALLQFVCLIASLALVAECRADVQKNGVEINPVSGAEIDALISELYRMPPDVVAKAREAVIAK